MNSDQITARFGSYHVEVLQQDTNRRLASLNSSHTDGAVCRTLAVTEFYQPIPTALESVDRDIRKGKSIGATMRSAGLQIHKQILVRLSARCGSTFAELSNQTVASGTLLHVCLYRLSAGASEATLEPYATIAEAHHPEHIPPRPDDPEASSATLDHLDSDSSATLQALLTSLT